jgi:hypothetical protein
MNAGTRWGNNTIGPSGRSVERPRDVTLPYLLPSPFAQNLSASQMHQANNWHPSQGWFTRQTFVCCYNCQMFASSPWSRSHISFTWLLDLPNDTIGYTRQQTASQAQTSPKVCVGCGWKLIDISEESLERKKKTGRSFIANQTQAIPLMWVTFTDSLHKKNGHMANICKKYTVSNTWQVPTRDKCLSNVPIAAKHLKMFSRIDK